MTKTDPLLVLAPSPARRIVTLGTLYALGGLILYITLTTPPVNILWSGFLLLIAAAAIWTGVRATRATRDALELYPDGLYSTDGTLLARIEDIKGVERGPFAFKPSGGFLLRVRESQPGAWAPGLWWRFGRSIGVGGVTSASPGKVMAETIADMIKRTGQ